MNQLCVIFEAVLSKNEKWWWDLKEQHYPFCISVPVTLNIAEQSFNITHQKSHNLFSPLCAKAENAKSPVKQRVSETLWSSL